MLDNELKSIKTFQTQDFPGVQFYTMSRDEYTFCHKGVNYKVAKVGHLPVTLHPGEVGISGEFDGCSAIVYKPLGNNGNTLEFAHHLRDMSLNSLHHNIVLKLIHNGICVNEREGLDYLNNVLENGSGIPLYEEILIIGREPGNQARILDPFTKKLTIANIKNERKGLFNVAVYNNPNNPGSLQNISYCIAKTDTYKNIN